MKKNIFLAVMLTAGTLSAQKVGINTETPKTTLEVIPNADPTHEAGVLAPRLTRAELTAKGDNLYGTDQTGALVYITDVSGGDANAPQREEVVREGYYLFDGTKWQKVLYATEYENFYIKDGALTGNRIVTQNANTLTFKNTTKGGTTFKSNGTTTNQVPAIQIKDGKQGANKVLMSDEQGNVFWESPSAPVLTGTFTEIGNATDIYDSANAYNTGISITLPKGTWGLSIATEVKLGKPTDKAAQGPGSRWGVLFLSPNNAPTVAGDTGIISQNSNFAVNTEYLAAQPIPTYTPSTYLWGSQIVTVNTETPQTLYVYFLSKTGYGTAINDKFSATGYRVSSGSFSKKGLNSYFYAVKLK